MSPLVLSHPLHNLSGNHVGYRLKKKFLCQIMFETLQWLSFSLGMKAKALTNGRRDPQGC